MVREAKSQNIFGLPENWVGVLPKRSPKADVLKGSWYCSDCNLRPAAASIIPLDMRNDCSGIKIVLLLNCFHLFKHSWNTSKDKSKINPVILTLPRTWVAKGSSWRKGFNTVLFWLKLCLSMSSLFTCIKEATGLYNEHFKFEVQAASPYCVFLDTQCQLLIDQST